jgi:hypothetical protein
MFFCAARFFAAGSRLFSDSGFFPLCRAGAVRFFSCVRNSKYLFCFYTFHKIERSGVVFS